MENDYAGELKRNIHHLYHEFQQGLPAGHQIVARFWLPSGAEFVAGSVQNSGTEMLLLMGKNNAGHDSAVLTQARGVTVMLSIEPTAKGTIGFSMK